MGFLRAFVPSRQGRTFAWLAAALALAATALVRGHEAEHTAVSFTFARDGTFVLQVANDPNWLLLRLESFVAMERPTPDRAPAVAPGRLSDSERDAKLRALAPVFIDRIVIWVDGHEVRPESAEYVPPLPQTGADSLPPLAAYRLRGTVAADARVMRWYYGMVADAYPLEVARADGRAQKEWIVAGDAWSRTLDLAGQFATLSTWEIAREYLALGYTRVLPRGVAFVLFVLGLFLLRLEAGTIVRQVAAFTIGHVLALWLVATALLATSSTSATLTPPAGLVGGLVALSVVYVAVENLATRQVKPWRMVTVFLCGLAHGAALAGALSARPAPAGQSFTALVSFTLGVEGGQLTVLAVALLGALALRARALGVRL